MSGPDLTLLDVETRLIDCEAQLAIVSTLLSSKEEEITLDDNTRYGLVVLLERLGGEIGRCTSAVIAHRRAQEAPNPDAQASKHVHVPDGAPELDDAFTAASAAVRREVRR